tara:strand:+ start:259 stop:1740 length:1482 start_codon:yes stop_codon:yes gene_type:complete
MWSFGLSPTSAQQQTRRIYIPAQNKLAPEAWWDAVCIGDLQTLKTLREQDDYLDVRDKDGWTALLHAISNDQMPVIDWLLEQGADLTKESYHGYTTLMAACRKNNAPIATKAIEAGVPVNAYFYRKSAFSYAVINRALACMDLLAAHKAQMNLPDGNGQTPMGWAIQQGHFDLYLHMVQKLGLNPAKNQGPKEQFIISAMQHNRPDIMRQMAGFGLRPHVDTKQEDPLKIALGRGFLDCAMVLLEISRWEKEHPCNDAEKALIQAIIAGDTQRVFSLNRTHQNTYPLDFLPIAFSFAHVRGNLDLIRTMERTTISARHHASFYQSLQRRLHKAIETENFQYIEACLFAGARVDDPNSQQFIAKYLARNDSYPLLKLMMKNGFQYQADDAINSIHWLIDMAVENQDVDIVKGILQTGVRLPVDIVLKAVTQKDLKRIQILLESGMKLHELSFENKNTPSDLLAFTQETSTPQIYKLIKKAYDEEVRQQQAGDQP